MLVLLVHVSTTDNNNNGCVDARYGKFRLTDKK